MSQLFVSDLMTQLRLCLQDGFDLCFRNTADGGGVWKGYDVVEQGRSLLGGLMVVGVFYFLTFVYLVEVE
jgi:hypothetical protein